MLDGLNEDMAYIRDVMGWPPDPMPQAGYFSSVYLYDSALCTDNAPNTEQGGWQSNIGPYPMVLLSWVPVVNYDCGGITHEAIHAMVKGTPGGNNKAHWFNEVGTPGSRCSSEPGVTASMASASSTELPSSRRTSHSNPTAAGCSMAALVGPMRREWQTATGEGTWVGLSTIYSLPLPRALRFAGRQRLGLVQRNPRNILETLASGLGEAQIRRLITEYRARQACGFRPLRDAIINTGINNTWGQTLNRECGTGTDPANYTSTAYAPTTTSGSTITPDDYTLPGWSCDDSPLNVSGNEVRLNFKPVGANMRMQLAYWATDGTAVYSQPKRADNSACASTKRPRVAWSSQWSATPITSTQAMRRGARSTTTASRRSKV